MELLLLLISGITGFVTLLAIMKIFTIAHDIGVMKNTIKDFTQYYYKLNEYKLQKDSNTAGNTQ